MYPDWMFPVPDESDCKNCGRDSCACKCGRCDGECECERRNVENRKAKL